MNANSSILSLLGLITLICMPSAIQAAITMETTRGEFPNDLDGPISNSDLIQGLIATELPGDGGWHPANTSPSDQLPAFTDGVSYLSTLTGLLNDFPGDGNPTKLIQYDLGGAYDLDQISILTGNANNSDGRIFSTFVVQVSTNNGASFSPLGGLVPNFPDPNSDPNAPLTLTPNSNGYYQSAPSGFINNESGIPGTTEDAANLVEVFDDGGGSIAQGVTNIQFSFYAVNNTLGEMRDPFGPQDPNDPLNDPNNANNPFTGTNDGLTAAIEAPLVWEIDVFGVAAAAENADFDDSGAVDGLDFLRWQQNFPILNGSASKADGDANDDGNVTKADLGIWETQYGTSPPSISAIPEPGSAALLVMFITSVSLSRRERWRTNCS